MDTLRLSDNDLTCLLRDIDPWEPSPVVEETATRLAVTLADRAGPATARPRRRYAAAALGVSTLFLAAAGILADAWTGETAGGTPDGLMHDADGEIVLAEDGAPLQNASGADNSPMLDPLADGGLEIVAGLAPREMPLPAWVTWEDVVAYVLAPLEAARDGGESWGVASTDYFRTGYLFQATAAWQTEWLEATEMGDVVRARAALGSWRVTLDENRWAWDPGQADLPYELLAAAERGDVAAVRHDLELNGSTWIISRAGLANVYDACAPVGTEMVCGER